MMRRSFSQTDRLLVTQREAARLLSISERTLFALRDRGEIYYIRVGPRILYSVEDLQSWIETRKHGVETT